MNKQNKKGSTLLPEQVVKIVIALIVVGFLVFLLISLFFSRTDIDKQKQAEAFLSTGANSLAPTIRDLPPGQKTTLTIFNPSGWYLFSFTHVEKGKIPAKCGLEKCLCICDNTIIRDQVQYCQNNGVCLNVPNLVTYTKELEISINAANPPILTIQKNIDGGILIT